MQHEFNGAEKLGDFFRTGLAEIDKRKLIFFPESFPGEAATCILALPTSLPCPQRIFWRAQTPTANKE
jgi:hypothetical protein